MRIGHVAVRRAEGRGARGLGARHLAYDTLKVQILNSTGTVPATPATCSNLGGDHVQHTYDLSPCKGQSITVKFTAAEDSQLQTSFVLDDTTLNAC